MGGPRWKEKGSEGKALANPISKSILDLKSSLIKSNSKGILMGGNVRLACNFEQTKLLKEICFGRPVMTVDSDMWFDLSLEEAFYLYFSLKCIKLVGGDDSVKTDNDIWEYMISKNVAFPDVFKAYSHLRDKNYVVLPGGKFGGDFVAYHHRPSLVHSEYVVLVLSERKADRLRVWSDYESILRTSGGVGKTLLVFHVNRNGEKIIASSPSCLDGYSVEERTITRWDAVRSQGRIKQPELGYKYPQKTLQMADPVKYYTVLVDSSFIVAKYCRNITKQDIASLLKVDVSQIGIRKTECVIRLLEMKSSCQRDSYKDMYDEAIAAAAAIGVVKCARHPTGGFASKEEFCLDNAMHYFYDTLFVVGTCDPAYPKRLKHWFPEVPVLTISATAGISLVP